MGISAIFKRPKAMSSSSRASSDDSIKNEHRPRHIKRRPTVLHTSSTSDMDEPPTPNDSLKESRKSPRTRSSAAKDIAALGALPARLPTDSDLFGLYRLATPPLDSATPQLREIDPFEDSPPPRPLTSFEDPVYIPPLTLAATLVDDYSPFGGVAQVGSNGATNAATLATASTFSRSPTAAGNSLDLLSEFNASYNYLFGTLPSDTSASHTLGRASAKSAAAVTATPSRQSEKYTGMLSPVSAQTVANAPEESAEEEEEEEEEEAVSLKSSSPSEDSELLRELEEERRKEEERKAAEQRNRRRELIKQQVAFERMKERHRRQQQQQPVNAHNSVARWQKESASAVVPQAMYQSNGAINRGHSQVLAPHHASNIAYIAEANHATLPRHRHQGFPLVDTVGEKHSAPFSGYALPVPSAHPVKLASKPQSTKNPYLSDSSNDDIDDGSSSDDLTSIGSSDISCDPPLEPHEPGTVPLSINGGSDMGPRSVSQPILPSGASDASSDTSAKSQSSSTRRVRFHETVSVVFNTRHTVAGEDLEQDAHESDSDSSNASIDFNATNTSGANSGSCLAGSSPDEAFDNSNVYSHSRYQIPPTLIPTQSNSAQWYDEESTTVANSKNTSGHSSRNISPDGSKQQSRQTKHRIETQPLRDREAERELRKQAQNSRRALQPRVTAPPSNDPRPAPVSAPPALAPVAEAASDSIKPPVDRMAEARRALLGHYNVPNPELPVGRSIPRSGSASTASFVRTSSVKVLQPPSFARPKQRPAASNPQLNVGLVSEHKPVSITVKKGGDSTPAMAKHDDSDGDDVPLSTFARSRSEPMPSLPRRSTDDYLSRLATFTSNYDSDNNEKGAAKGANSRRFFGRNQTDLAGNPISHNGAQPLAPAPKVEEHVAKFEQMRSKSMDVTPRQSTEKRRFGRWGNFF
ncbi:hypothetical protein GGI20_000915 [Coemansia sp. BCRC 34301]|nr:hypothetical protein GGI20_000915 [Coemansia sp. BCRC 34301]